MIRDLSEPGVLEALGPDERAFDLVVVGTGPAAAVVVAELLRAGCAARIGVLESGRRRPWAFADRLRRCASDGIRIKPHSRERVLGGASTTWSGLSSPMDSIELRERPWLQVSGWPLSPDELDRGYAAAAERYRFAAPGDFDPVAGGLADIRARGGLRPDWQAVEEKVFLAAEEAQDFGKELAHVYDAPGVTLLLDASVKELELEAAPASGGGDPSAAARVAAARVRTSTGAELRVTGARFLVATGGIENARLLLNSPVPDGLAVPGLDPDGGALGRYMMNHPKNYHGVLHLAEPTRSLPYFFGCISRGFAGYGGLRLPDDAQERHGLVNAYVRFEPLFPWSDNRGVEALVHLVKRSRFLLTFWKRTKKDQVIELRDYAETGDDSELDEEQLSYLGLVLRVLKHLPSVAAYTKSRLLDRGGPLVQRVRVRNFLEMEPRRDHRVVLDDARDEHGYRLPRVIHDVAARDRESLERLHAALVPELERVGFGRLETALRPGASPAPWPIDQDASHHIGTTRMGDDPTTSVVDTDHRVHGTTNLHVSGASVFPTSGCANPTYTIVALAVLLAERLGPLVEADATGAAGPDGMTAPGSAHAPEARP